MLPSACTCPTCGSSYSVEVPHVDLNRNIFICKRGWRKLRPREAEILVVLVNSFPRMATFDDIFSGIYGMADEPDDAHVHLRIYISKIRKHLKPLGWALINSHSRGYRLAELEDRDG